MDNYNIIIGAGNYVNYIIYGNGSNYVSRRWPHACYNSGVTVIEVDL